MISNTNTDVNNVLSGLSLLYVDDDEEMWGLLSRILRRRFDRVDYARDGAEALDNLRQTHYHMLITDLEMPVMGGLELIQRVRATLGAELPIVVVTAYTDEEHHSTLANAYLFKPIDVQLLLQTMIRLAIPPA